MQFVQQYSHLGYGYTGRIDELRATQFPQLQIVTYLDHAAATLYSLQQLADATRELSQHLFANPHSQLGHDVDQTSSAIDDLRSLTLQMLKAPAEEYEVNPYSQQCAHAFCNPFWLVANCGPSRLLQALQVPCTGMAAPPA